jgi:type II secretory pathway predicted ATPase ExeA
MYETHFGFTERPFDDTTNPRYFFANAANQEAFATLCYGVESRKGLIVVTGEAGTGKSTLLRKLIRDRRAGLHAAYVFNGFVSFSELLKHVMNELNLTVASAGKAAMIAQLNDYLIRQLRADNVVCLLMDEAQNLNDKMLEEIRLLSNLEKENKKILQIVLAGQPELEQKLNQPNLRQLKQRIALRCSIAPLKTEEVGPYIDMRLQTAGFRGRGLFSPEAVEQIAVCSKGIPRLVNHICDNALLNAFATSKSRISVDIVQEVTQELKLSEQPRQIVEKDVSDLRRAVGDDIFRPTRRRTPTISRDVDTRDHDFDPPISNSKVWPVGFDPPKRNRSGPWRVALLLVILMIAGVAASLYSQGVTLSMLRSRVEQFADSRGSRRFQSASPAPATNPKKPADMDSKEQSPSTEVIPPSEKPFGAENPANGDFVPGADENVTSMDRSSHGVFDSRAEQPPKKNDAQPHLAPKHTKMEQPPDDETTAARELKIKIHRAIGNRAISGVDVHVRGNTVYLGGQVATHRQRRAAVLATRSVPGVKEVRDQIAVGRTSQSNPRS